MSDRPFSRRDFLKTAGIGAAALALKKPIDALAKATERFNIETPKAKYFPFYERHDVGISLDELKQINGLDIFFTEGVISTQKKLTEQATDYLYVSGGVPGSETQKRFFPDEYLRYFGDRGIDVSTEGLSLNPESTELSDNVKKIEYNIASIISMEESIRLAYNGIKNKISKDQKITYPLSAVYWLWAVSPTVSEKVLSLNENPNTDPSERDILAIHEFAQRMHPEYLKVSLRNIFMARRLQVLGEDKSNEKGRKANLAFEVGKAHSGIERFLELGEDATIDTLNIYPTELLRKIVEFNGGAENNIELQISIFCSVISVPVKETLEGRGYKKILIDEKMRDYLRKRLL